MHSYVLFNEQLYGEVQNCNKALLTYLTLKMIDEILSRPTLELNNVFFLNNENMLASLVFECGSKHGNIIGPLENIVTST